MELQIAGTNTELNPEAKQYIERKLNKLGKHLPDIIDIKVEVSDEDTRSPQQRYLVRATVNSGIGRSLIHGEERAEDLFKAVDKVTAILTRQLEKQKGKLYDRGRGNSQVRGKFIKPAPVESTRKVVKTKHFLIEPMSREEAIAEMERLRHSFFLFLDPNANELRLLYRRKDGNYGIIEPEIEQ
jgi:putative sigma-54 modulation protein